MCSMVLIKGSSNIEQYFIYSTSNQTWPLSLLCRNTPLMGTETKMDEMDLVSCEKYFYFLVKNMSIGPVIVEL